ncbi:CTQ-dependent glycine oxidase GoxA [Microvirga puerhi]|uniref:CTQ-dependent glycine oxidase GoxA n=1 Tax=Microvirga puerhi TaxID=2876078 RepID=A0ABS7VUY2_9HYPH|nr:CTQ-dependent glycine oxidase GoxA [Microvirga puerhi]MBZ6078984.1 CTQ-dependent glycine oxidase GoxA [Microvirga puerhi]
MANSDKNRPFSRRDFLATVAAGTAAYAMPWHPKSAVAATTAEPAPAGAKIAKVRVYPAIGICRVGGSSKWFLAPEVPGLTVQPEGGFKDGAYHIKKQVQRFRVYAFDANDRVIGEVTPGKGRVEWRVHLANTKAAWYGFTNPLDNGDLAPGVPGVMRNAYIVDDAERERMLVIDGGEKMISGASVNIEGGVSAYKFQGRFWDKVSVNLGELRTDEEGRLLVVPPDGKSASPIDAGITSFADNDGWYDDWCDGPVQARVKLADGQVLEAEPAWVACVGPDFVPEIQPISTLFDVVQDLNTKLGWIPKPAKPLSFRKYIYPTFRRVALMEWLTDADRLRQGWLEVGDFSDPRFIDRLADPSGANKAFRESVFALFRNPEKTGPEAFREERLKIPYMLGDGVNFPGSPLQWFQFPALQYSYLKSWATGDFVNDLHDAKADAIGKLEDLPVELQPSALTEAALERCSGGAFHPGVELTYYLRHAPMYSRSYDDKAEPFRIALGGRQSLLQNVGRQLNAEKAFKGTGDVPAPIGRQMPGDLTRWMGLPWQCDAFSCQQVQLQENFPVAVWWPALLPIDVLSEAYYAQVLRADLSAKERIKFLNSRVPWSREVSGLGLHPTDGYWRGITNMISLWERMGFVVKHPGPTDAGKPEGIPEEIFVEVGRAPTMERRIDWKPGHGLLP